MALACILHRKPYRFTFSSREDVDAEGVLEDESAAAEGDTSPEQPTSLEAELKLLKKQYDEEVAVGTFYRYRSDSRRRQQQPICIVGYLVCVCVCL